MGGLRPEDVLGRGHLKLGVVEVLLQNLLLEGLVPQALDQALDLGNLEDASRFADLAGLRSLIGQRAEGLDDYLHGEILERGVLACGVLVGGPEVPLLEDEHLVLEVGELHGVVVFPELIDRLLGEVGLDEVEAVSQPGRRDVVVNVHAHALLLDAWRQLVEVAV